MAALTAGRQTDSISGKKKAYPMAAATTIFQGSIVAINSSGNAVPMSTTTGLLGCGIARSNAGLDKWDNSAGAAGDVTVEVDEGAFAVVQASTIAAGAEGKPCFGVDDQTVSLTSTLGTKSPAGRVVQVLSTTKVVVYFAEWVAREIVESAADRVIPAHVTLAAHTTDSIAARFTPGYAGRITKITAQVTNPVTTAAKLGTFTPAIAATPTTGGAVALTSANCTPVGAKVNGTAITAANTFTAAQEVTVIATAVTAFIEGEVDLLIFLTPIP